ncbi:MAG: glycosyltransferase family 2 protein [Candidatus Hodarchaeota archaeon]
MCDKRLHQRVLLTVAILNYNGLERLKRSIPSILAQDYEPKEVLVLDNASQDDSVKYLNQFKEIKTIAARSNLGYGVGKNILVEKAQGDYVLMLDNDIELCGKDFLSKIYWEYIALDNPAYLSPLLCDIGKNDVDCGGFYFNKINKNAELRKIANTGVLKVPRYVGGVCFFKKSMFGELGGFDEIYPFNIDDYDMSARAYLNGYVNYRTTNLMAVHNGSDTRTNIKALCWKRQYYFSGFSRMVWKNYKLRNVIIWWPISAAWISYKSIRTSIRNRSVDPLLANLKSIRFFIRDFRDTLKWRKNIQMKRHVHEDLFLRIKYLRSC